MIIEALGDNWTMFVIWLFSFLPAPDGIEELSAGITGVLDPLASGLGGLGGWIPWSTVNTCAYITLAFWTVSLILRAIKSFLPTMSG